MRRDWVRVLLIEDDEDDYLLTRELLEGSVDPLVELDWMRSYPAALAAIAKDEYDLYLVDYRLGTRTGLELIAAQYLQLVLGLSPLETGLRLLPLTIAAMASAAAQPAAPSADAKAAPAVRLTHSTRAKPASAEGATAARPLRRPAMRAAATPEIKPAAASSRRAAPSDDDWESF